MFSSFASRPRRGTGAEQELFALLDLDPKRDRRKGAGAAAQEAAVEAPPPKPAAAAAAAALASPLRPAAPHIL